MFISASLPDAMYPLRYVEGPTEIFLTHVMWKLRSWGFIFYFLFFMLGWFFIIILNDSDWKLELLVWCERLHLDFLI